MAAWLPRYRNYVGMLGNALPLPGAIGGVEGGMIGSFLAFGVNGGLAVLAVWAPDDLVLAPDAPGRDRVPPPTPWRRRPQ